MSAADERIAAAPDGVAQQLDATSAAASAEHHAASATNKWLVAAAVIVPTILEVVDGTVVTVVMPHMQGSLNAGVDEVTWVLTSYLVANGIVIPLTGWLSALFGRKRFFLLCIALFTLSSFLCGAATNLPLLIAFRLVQGASGATMIPLSQAILLETFPRQEHGMAMAVWGVGVMFAPIVGPVLGGWITEHYTWRWAFYINVPLGVLAFVLTSAFVHDPPYVKRSLAVIDYVGLGLLTLGIGGAQLVLDRGERADWFAATWVWVTSSLAAAALAAFILWELRHAAPIVDFRLLKSRNYAMGIVLHTVLGFVLYSSVTLQPLYAQILLGYDALNAGVMMMPGGFGTLLTMPLAGVLMNRLDARWLLLLGMTVTNYSLLLMSHLTLEVSMWQLSWPRIIWGLGMGFYFVPLSAAAIGAVNKEKMGDASALFNLMRNLGGSIGVALAVTLLSRRAQFHQHVLVSHVTPYHPQAMERLARLWQGLVQAGADPVTAQTQAQQLIYLEAQRQSVTMAFLDSFWLIGILSLACAPLVFLMRKFTGGMTIGH
jgi:DHA2 family multidrug resistance protein